MIYDITIENFFSIAEAQEISFAVHANAPDLFCFRESCSVESLRLPTCIGFFGANASGKTTVLRALTSAMMFALHSFDQGEEIILSFQTYRRKDWRDKPTKIIIDFDGQLHQNSAKTKFRYELHVSHSPQDFSTKIVSYEALFYSPKGKFRRLFERQKQEFFFGSEFGISTSSEKKDSIRPNASVLSTLAKLNHPESTYLWQLIGKIQTNLIAIGKVRQNNVAPLLANYANDKACLDRLNHELRRFDVGLDSMSIEQSPQGYFAKLKHIGLDSSIFLDEESAGTQRFIEIFPRIHYALQAGSIAIIDELDTDIHPLLLPEIFRWFSDPSRNPLAAQLLFTANNPVLLDDLEKEQIFFADKPSGQATHVYGVRDIKGLRRDPSLMKKYLSGELGAVPHIG